MKFATKDKKTKINLDIKNGRALAYFRPFSFHHFKNNCKFLISTKTSRILLLSFGKNCDFAFFFCKQILHQKKYNSNLTIFRNQYVKYIFYQKNYQNVNFKT